MQSSYQPASQSVLPPVIKNLLILNGLVFLAKIVPTTADFIDQWFALWPIGDYPDFARYPDGTLAALGHFYPWQVLTYGFLHGDFTHILFNMFALWMFGISLENNWGSRRFGIYYFFCLVGAGLVQLFVATMELHGTGVPHATLGASGGVMGILLGFGVMYPDVRLMLLFPPIPIKAKWLVMGYAALDLFAGVTGTQSGVAHFAHLAGMGFGLILILYWRGKLPWKPRERLYL